MQLNKIWNGLRPDDGFALKTATLQGNKSAQLCREAAHGDRGIAQTCRAIAELCRPTEQPRRPTGQLRRDSAYSAHANDAMAQEAIGASRFFLAAEPYCASLYGLALSGSLCCCSSGRRKGRFEYLNRRR